MQIATWNINGIRARLPRLLEWLKALKPDVVCLQEVKCETALFPKEVFEELGYYTAYHGQKGFNGVALLSRFPLEDLQFGLPDDAASGDTQARYLEAVISAQKKAIRIGCLYLPNGNPMGSEKYTYKLAWMKRFKAHAKSLLELEEPLILTGDYNIIPEEIDAKNPEKWKDDALFSVESRSFFFSLLALGFSDAVRLVYPLSVPYYTFWDYQARSWEKDNGIRIDHCLLSPQAADLLSSAFVDREQRGCDTPSDHVPVVITLEV